MKTKIKIFKYFELGLIFLSAMLVWYLADNLFQTDTDNWSGVILSTILFFVAWSLGAIVVRNTRLFLITTLLALLTQLFFTQSASSLITISISFFLLWIARIFIKQEIRLRLKVDIWNYLRVGRRFLVLAIALMLAGQYYFSNNPQIASENLPKLKFTHNQEGLMTKIVALVDPSLMKENKEAVTVNEFIAGKFNDDPLASKRFGAETDFNNISYYQKEVILKGGREDVSKMVERNVAGDEKMIDIFLEIINNKIDDFLNVSVGYMDRDMPVAHLIFTVAIFLAIMGSGMLASLFLILIVAIIFRILILINLLSIDKKAVNMEVVRIG